MNASSALAAPALRERLSAVRDTLAAQLVGHESLVERLLIALLTGGHVLLEGPPGVAKTRTVNRFAELLDARFARIQATPDLLPADITGTDVFDPKSGEFRFMAGPLFNNVVLVDEINRAPPKVQSALLEAMGRAADHHRRHDAHARGALSRRRHPEPRSNTRAPTRFPRRSSIASCSSSSSRCPTSSASGGYSIACSTS